MNTAHQVGLPKWMLWFFNATVIPGIIIFLITSFYSVTSPLAPDAELSVPVPLWLRLVAALVIGPLSILVGWMITRRVPNRIIGQGLIGWGCATGPELGAPYLPHFWSALGLTYMMVVVLPAFMLMIASFPTGRGVTPAWERRVNRLVVVIVFSALLTNLSTPTAYGHTGPNPLAVGWLVPLYPVANTITGLLIPGTLVLALALLVHRYRMTTNSVERKQLRWLAFFAMLFAVLIILDVVTDNFKAFAIGPYFLTVLSASFLTMPTVAIGIAILRHRLWDIDIIIRRTLIYTILTGILAAVYFGSVVLAQQIFRAATGQSSDLAIVVSTLLIAALFTPLRRRIQDTIDRRLYRRKYNVEQTLEAFNRTLRDEVDLETLKSNLINVVDSTMQPNKIALWVKDPARKVTEG